MLVKRYHVNNMQEAMDTVIKELGSDAVILNSRKVRKKGLKFLFSKPLLEVMVAYDPAKVPSNKRSSRGIYLPVSQQNSGLEQPKPQERGTVNAPPTTTPSTVPERVAGTAKPSQISVNTAATIVDQVRLQEIDNRIDSIDKMLSNFMSKFSFVKRDITYDYSEGVEDLVLRLIENQVREELAHNLARETDAILKRQQGARPTEVMEHLMYEQLGVPEPISHKKYTQKVVLFIGATGVGKTTSLVKLAADFSVNQKKKVGIINTDTYRIAAQEQLKAYADILSIPLAVVYQPSELTEAMELMQDRELVFIDTAGKRPGDEQHKEDIKKIIEITKPEEILLCVSASTSFSALTEVIDTYAFVDELKLLITKLDETRYRGIILNLSWYSQRSLAYITTGQNVPDDIEDIDVKALVDQLLRQ